MSYQNNFSPPETLFEAGGAVFIVNSNIDLRKISLTAYFKAISHYFGFNGPTRCRTSFTEFGGELGDQQRPTLERNDMKLGPFN